GGPGHVRRRQETAVPYSRPHRETAERDLREIVAPRCRVCRPGPFVPEPLRMAYPERRIQNQGCNGRETRTRKRESGSGCLNTESPRRRPLEAPLQVSARARPETLRRFQRPFLPRLSRVVFCRFRISGLALLKQEATFKS